jgi:hypothetical protein
MLGYVFLVVVVAAMALWGFIGVDLIRRRRRWR